MTTPNLFAPFTEYHVDLSAADSTLNIPLKDLILTYQRASASALRISIVPKNTAAPVLVDLRRTTIYDGSTIEIQTLNGSSISASIAIDGTVYTNSQETHNMCIRQQEFQGYQINDELMAAAKPGAMVMHCLPAYRGQEITEKIFEEHASEIFEEAENRLHAQKAVMVTLMK